MYPKRVIDFIAWSKAMVAGATMDRPEYRTTGSKRSGKTRSGRGFRLRNRRRRRRRSLRRSEE